MFRGTRYLQGVPRNMTVCKTTWISSWFLIWFAAFLCQPNFRSKFLEIIITKFPLSCHFQNVVCLFCAFNIARDMNNFVQISTILLLFNKIEIWTKLFMPPVILKAQKTQTTFWKSPGNYVIIVSRIIHVKVDRILNVTNKFKY